VQQKSPGKTLESIKKVYRVAITIYGGNVSKHPYVYIN